MNHSATILESKVELFYPRSASYAQATPDDAELGEGWQRIIDQKLIEWGRNPSQFDDEITPPTRRAIDRVLNFISQVKSKSMDLPSWVVPTGDGGIVLRWGSAGAELVSLEIDQNGEAELIRTIKCKITDRRSF